MSRLGKRLEEMQRSPERGWSQEELIPICREVGIRCVIPTAGSHYVLSHHLVDGFLTIPAARPLKPFHVMLASELIESVVEGKKWYEATTSSSTF
jgi:hypothetical protein